LPATNAEPEINGEDQNG